MMFLCILTGDLLRLRRYSSHIAGLAAIYMFLFTSFTHRTSVYFIPSMLTAASACGCAP